ncbi:MAG: carboxypeptidase-like regulatory domain-containing protein [Cyclobacteriaceae bacterium]|nr:carboxypeptidase-like regulatory domain-containing protein [Cyclobacteriaceae bacterium]UYN86839.1 MAG: carboxypeptidase-like regulatory domain-containing protein [Cyclobacteriaceae bacterium]
MKSTAFKWTFLFAIAHIAVFGQQVIEGRVIDKETHQPVPFASIGIVGTSKGTSSNLNGQFTLSVEFPFTLKISCVGYESQTIQSTEDTLLIKLKPASIELSEIVIFRKTINPGRIVQRAFANVIKNYSTQPFLQKFFYRHYCKDDDEYGRLIEASVDVWKHRGYKSAQQIAGEKEEIRVTQLRRSLDNTVAAQGHEPIAIGNVLQADIVGYQIVEKGKQLSFYNTVSNLRADFDRYNFSYDATTVYDGQEVYLIAYASKKDSIPTTSGYIDSPKITGLLYITTDRYAIVKTEETKSDGPNVIRTSAYYRKTDDKYFPYHFIREGESRASDNSVHQYHIELMSTEIRFGIEEKFVGKEPGKEELLRIPYDSGYWKTNTVLKTTPLEDKIIRDLGGGQSLNKQFYRYQQYEWSTTDGGQNGEEKFKWLKDHSAGSKILLLVFWGNPCDLSCVVELEHAKRLQRQFRKNLAVVMIALENDEAKWKQLVSKYNLFADGIINYRVDSHSEVKRLYTIKETPAYILLNSSGDVHSETLRPGNALLENEIRVLIDQR